MGTIIILAIAAAVVFWVVATYNSLIALKNQVFNAFKQIDVQLKRRHDLIPNLVNAVKGAMQFERETLEAVIQARNQAVQVQQDASPASMGKLARAEGALTAALGRLLVVVERYPELRATGNIAALQEELTSTENKVAFSRQHYNDVATQYNTRQAQFPANLVAGLAKASPAELWEITEEAERAVPQVDLTSKPKA